MVRASRLIALALACLTVPAHAQDRWSLETLQGRPQLTAEVPLGDLDGDGRDDFGQPWDNHRVRVFLGRGRFAPEDTPNPEDWSVAYTMPAVDDFLTLVGAGDVDGDGHADIAIGVVPDSTDDFDAYVVVHRGAARPEILSSTPWVVAAGQTGSRFGSVMAAGDLNGDGFSDLVIATPGAVADPLAPGMVVVHLGSSEGLEARAAWRAEGPPGFGAALACPDFDGDGQADLLIGGPEGVMLFRGRRRQDDTQLDFAPLAADALVLASDPVGDVDALRASGDLDGDGFADAVLMIATEDRIDLLLGAPAPGPGRVLSVDLAELALELRSGGPAGDLDGDGLPDVAFGASANDASKAASGIYVLFGGQDRDLSRPIFVQGSNDERLRLVGDYDGDGFADLRAGERVFFGQGNTVGAPTSLDPAAFVQAGQPPFDPEKLACAGDVDGDGFDCLVLTAGPEEGGDCPSCSRALLARGSPAGLVASTFDDRGRRDELQREAVRVGDLDGDGRDDVLMVAPMVLSDPPGRGRAEVLWGAPAGLVTAAPGQPAWSITGPEPDAALGNGASGAGDSDGDGRLELTLATNATVGGPVSALYGFVDGALAKLHTWEIDPTLPEGARRGDPRGAGDVDGDGRGDFATLDSTVDHVPRLRLIHGTATGPGEESVIGIGTATVLELAPAGDVDGDGLADLAMTFMQIENERPSLHVRLMYGATSLVRPDAMRVLVSDALPIADPAHPWIRSSLRWAGDLDADGHMDFVVTAHDHDGNRGRMQVFNGIDGGFEPRYVRDGDTPDLFLGAAVTGACDFDGDRFSDVAVISHVVHAPNLLDVHYGNGAFGHRSAFAIAPIAVQPDALARRIAPGTTSTSRTSFAVAAWGRSPFGPARVRLEVEVAAFEDDFTGDPVAVGPWVGAPAGESVRLSVALEGLLPDTAYRWRARIGYDPSQAPLTSHSRWLYPQLGPAPGRVDVRTRHNASPSAADDVVFTRDGVAFLAPPGLLANDGDADGDALSVRTLALPAHGELISFPGDGSMAYRAEPGFTGVDRFEYAAGDALGAEASATVTIVGGDCDPDRCGRGDYFVAVTTRSGALKSIHCWLDAAGDPQCEIDPDGMLVLRDPVCEPF